MKNLCVFLLACALGVTFCACGVPKRQPEPDVDKIRQEQQEASQDLRQEEDRKAQKEDGEEEEQE